MHCLGTTCNQGRSACLSPMLCSGAAAETDAAIRLYRAMHAPIARELPVQFAEPEPFTAEAVWAWVDRLRTPALVFAGVTVFALCLLVAAGVLHTF